jgi:diguanylate cyclase (GGDEF)-like protein
MKSLSRIFRRTPAQSEVFENRVLFRDWKRELDRDELAELSPEPALSLVVAILHCFGRYSFDVEHRRAAELKAGTGDWIAHLLNGDPAPSGRPVVSGSRDWRGTAEFFRDHRKQEQLYVTRSMGGLRDLIWDFVARIGATVSAERGSNSEIQQRLSRLREAVEIQNIDSLRQEVLQTAQFIGCALQEREKRQMAQLRQLGMRLREMRAELAEVRQRLAIDSLTRVYNRHALEEHLDRVVQLAQFSGQTPYLFILDADQFKEINDRFGHQVGDRVLRKIADCCVRTFPRESDFIARYGGDEFVIVADECGSEVAAMMAERLLDWVRSLKEECEGEPVLVTASVGAATLQPGDTVDQWFRRADEALRVAKVEGRDRWVVYESLIRQESKGA